MGEPMAADLGAGEVVPAGASAEGQLWDASGAVAERRESSPAGSELSTGKMNPRAAGWNKRQLNHQEMRHILKVNAVGHLLVLEHLNLCHKFSDV